MASNGLSGKLTEGSRGRHKRPSIQQRLAGLACLSLTAVDEYLLRSAVPIPAVRSQPELPGSHARVPTQALRVRLLHLCAQQLVGVEDDKGVAALTMMSSDSCVIGCLQTPGRLQFPVPMTRSVNDTSGAR